MPAYKVDIIQTINDSHYSGEQFGDWYESCQNDFKSISIAKEHGYVSDLDVPIGAECYVVWVEYSTGDSFGRGYRNQNEFVAVFTDVEDAYALKTQIESDDGGEYQGTFTRKDGGRIVFYQPWRGYFEDLEEVHVEKTWMHGA